MQKIDSRIAVDTSDILVIWPRPQGLAMKSAKENGIDDDERAVRVGDQIKSKNL